MINKVIKLLYWIALLIALAIAITIFAPATEHLILWQYVILFSPRYCYVFLCLFLLAMFHKLSRVQRYSLPIFFLVGYFYLDIALLLARSALRFAHNRKTALGRESRPAGSRAAH